jgi:hypothetical protein
VNWGEWASLAAITVILIAALWWLLHEGLEIK